MTTPLLSRHTPIKILEQIRKRIRVEKRYQSSFDSVSSEKQLVSLFSDEELQGMMMTFNVLHPHGCQPTELETPTFALHSFRNTIRVKMHPIEYKYLADPFVEVKSSYELVKIFGQSRLRGALLVYNHIYPLNTNANANANTSTSTGTNTADVQQQGELPIAEATQQRENSQRLSSFIRGLQIMERMIRDEHRRQRQNEEEKEEEEGEEEGDGEEGNFRGRRVELVSELMEWDSGASDEDSDSEEGTETRDGAGNREGAETREGAEEEEDKNDFDPYDALQFGERTNSFVVHLPEDSVESHFG